MPLHYLQVGVEVRDPCVLSTDVGWTWDNFLLGRDESPSFCFGLPWHQPVARGRGQLRCLIIAWGVQASCSSFVGVGGDGASVFFVMFAGVEWFLSVSFLSF